VYTLLLLPLISDFSKAKQSKAKSTNSIMMFGSSMLLRGSFWLVFLISACCTDAFHVHPATSASTLIQKQMAQVLQQQQEAQPTTTTTKTNPWRVPRTMNMVAGGAERAYGDDYYDGTCVFLHWILPYFFNEAQLSFRL
jgi:hypothetical protein